MYGESHDEHEKHLVIFLPNAVVEPYAVMIELPRASIASSTVLRRAQDMRVAAIAVVFVHVLWEIFIFYSHASLHEYHLICRVSLDCNKSEDENNDV